MNLNRQAIKLWMREHATEYENGPALASAAIDYFKCHEEGWMWDAAQEIYDLVCNHKTSMKYE